MSPLPRTDTPPALGLEEIEARLDTMDLPPVEGVVAIERGGHVVGELLAARLGVPFASLRLSYRDDRNDPLWPEPRVVEPAVIRVPAGERILVVDDVSVTGATLRAAARELSAHEVVTLVLIGRADLVVFPEIVGCVTWPWTLRADPL